MKKIFRNLYLLTLFLLCSVFLCACSGKKPALFKDSISGVQPNENVHVSVKASDQGQDVYAPVEGAAGYRYGPSILYYADGSWDAWFATNGGPGEWDWISYKHSDDGESWSDEQIVLRPTGNSMDHYSCCDPGVIYFGGYYYLGYTSTIVDTNGGINNNVFVARSENPDGPFEKWNGSGWGGKPQPIVYYNEVDTSWGAGEISFVLVDDVLYCYYTWMCPDGNFLYVSTADVCENWPATMQFQNNVYRKVNNQDSFDVVYVEDVGKFLAFCTSSRFSENSGIAVLESNDGIHFYPNDIFHEGVFQFCHNMGVSKRPDGHVQLKDNLLIGYGYSDGGDENWGKWATRFQGIQMTTYEGEVEFSDQSLRGIYRTDYFWDYDPNAGPISFSCTYPYLERYRNGAEDLYFVWYDTYMSPHYLEDPGKVKFSNYDKDVVSFDKNEITFKGVGETLVTATYKGMTTVFTVAVRDFDDMIDEYWPEIKSFTPVQSEIVINLREHHKPQIRAFVVFSDNTWGEGYNDCSSNHPPFKANVDGDRYPITYEVADPDIVTVNLRGVLDGKKAGETTVKVTAVNGMTFEVKVKVIDDEE